MRCYTSAVPLGRRPAVHARTCVAVATSSLVQRGNVRCYTSAVPLGRRPAVLDRRGVFHCLLERRMNHPDSIVIRIPTMPIRESLPKN